MATMRMFADITELATIRQFVAQAAQDAGVNAQATLDLQLAVDEICSNVIEHSYGGQGGEIEITVEATEDGLRAKVRNWGTAFDPQAVPVPDVTSPLEQRRLGGLGLYLVRKVMDDVCFEFDAQKGNLVTMIKRIRPKEGGV